MRLRGARVLVTGAYGFIGRAVVGELADAGARVVAAYRPDTRPEAALPGDSIALDLLDHGALVRSFDGVDLVVHLAARSGGIAFQNARNAEIFSENYALTKGVLAAAAQAGVTRVFLASSAVVYREGGTGQLLDETAPVVTPGREPVSGYAWSKLTDEALGGWYGLQGLEVVTGRFGNVYGPGGSPSTVVHALVHRALAAPPGGRLVVWGDGTAVRSFLYLSDAARAAVTVLERGDAGQVYNLDSSTPTAISELAKTVRDTVAALGGDRLRIEFDPSRPTGPVHRVLDNTKLAGLGFVPRVSLGIGVHATVIGTTSLQCEF